MISKATILKGRYLDSVKLMLISKELRGIDNVVDAVVIMATRENREILASTNMLVKEIETAEETDLVAVVKCKDEATAEAAISMAERLVSSPPGNKNKPNEPRKALSLEKAAQRLKEANLCLISVAGKYAAAEADKALDLGLHVMLFSDNVTIDDELALKTKAVAQCLLMMGPDCGTAIINGVPLAFANSVPRGKIGIVSASGTGLQEISSGIANLGGGVSQAFGTGGRDGKKEIGGLMLMVCLDYLIRDDDTQVIVLMGKTPDQEVLNKLLSLLNKCNKPVIVNFLKPMQLNTRGNVSYQTSLYGTAVMACKAAGYTDDVHSEGLKMQYVKPDPGRKYLRGLYSGGTLCAEAIQTYIKHFGVEPYSNVGSDPAHCLVDGWKTMQDSLIDLGSDEFTVGRPHPMIDYSLRMQKLEQEADDPEVGVILLDVVLGYGAHPDPAQELAPLLKRIDKGIVVVCDVLGTRDDPQHKSKQIAQLQEAGAIVFDAHCHAIDYACHCLKAVKGDKC